MVITYHGLGCFKVAQGDTTLVFDPVSKSSKAHKPVSFGTDIVLVSFNHPDTNGVDQVTRGDKEPFVITGPGEYEVHDITIYGFQSSSEYAGTKQVSTIYRVVFDDIQIVYAGTLGSGDIDSSVKEELGSPDILFVPIGGKDVLDSKAAHKLGVQLEAKTIIPMHYDAKALKAFLKEEGESGDKPQDKLTIKKKDFAGREGDIIVLTER